MMRNLLMLSSLVRNQKRPIRIRSTSEFWVAYVNLDKLPRGSYTRYSSGVGLGNLLKSLAARSVKQRKLLIVYYHVIQDGQHSNQKYFRRMRDAAISSVLTG